jgi:hypothetical protein
METTVATHKDAWIKDVDRKLIGVSYPMHRDVAEEKLRGLRVEGDDAIKYFSNIEWPVSSHDDFVNKFRLAKIHASGSEHKPTMNTGGLTS